MPLDASSIDADADLDCPRPDGPARAPARAIAVKSLLVTAVAQKGTVDYEATAESLGGKVRFHGSAPIDGDLSKAIAEARDAGRRLPAAARSGKGSG